MEKSEHPATPAASGTPAAAPADPAATTDASVSGETASELTATPAADLEVEPGTGTDAEIGTATEAEHDEPQIAPPAPAPQARAKTKGVADIVFLIDTSGSMAPVIDALRKNIEVFIDSLSGADANNAAPVKDWRAKVVGFRDAEHDRDWYQDHPFVRDAVALKAQLGSLRAEGGGDEPESLLDALYQLATLEATPKGAQSEEANKWRYRSDAARVVVVFTDATFRETMSIPEAKGGALQDVANVIMANRIILSIFAPNFEVYDRLSQIDKSEWEVVEYEGLTPQQALQKYTSDQANFRNTLKQLAASVSKSAETVAL